MARKPDYVIKALDKETDERGTIGAAWANKDGSITLVFSPFVVVPVNSKRFVVTMFKNDDRS